MAEPRRLRGRPARAVPLLALAAEPTGNAGLGEMAVSYAFGIGVLCVRPDGSVSQAATFDEAGRLAGQHSPNASSDRSTWGRALVGQGRAAGHRRRGPG
jgi:hypothetical protein